MSQLAAEVDALVTAMVTIPWPTTSTEYPQWARKVGLPASGEPFLAMDEAMPGSTHFFTPHHPWHLSWHYFRDEFVGVSFFPGDALAPDELRAFARELRDCFDAHWGVGDSIDATPPLTTFMSYWLSGGRMIELYWHAPQVDPLGNAQSGSVQLGVSHEARGQAEDAVAAAGGKIA